MQALLRLLYGLVGSLEDVRTDRPERVVGDVGGFVGQEFLQWLQIVEQGLNIAIRFPSTKDFKFPQSNGNLRFVIVIGELVRVFGMEFCRQFLIRVDLQWQCLCY